jgi:hypothetical protein
MPTKWQAEKRLLAQQKAARSLSRPAVIPRKSLAIPPASEPMQAAPAGANQNASIHASGSSIASHVCSYVPSTVTALTRNPPSSASRSKHASSTRSDMTLTITGPTRATISPGLSVSRVVTADETSRFYLRNVPLRFGRDALEEKLREYGAVKELNIPGCNDEGSNFAQIMVRMSAHNEAIAAVDALNGTKIFGSELSARCLSMKGKQKEEFSDQEVYVSWPLKTIRGYVGFDEREDAEKLAAAANGYNLSGYWIVANVYEGMPIVREYNVRFDGLPPNMSRKRLKSLFHVDGEIMIDFPEPELKDHGVSAVKKLLGCFGRISRFQTSPAPYKDGRVQAWCQFFSPDVAQFALKSVNGPQRALNNEILDIKRVRSVSFSTCRQAYVFFQNDIQRIEKSATARYEGFRLETVDADVRKNEVVIKLAAESTEGLSIVKRQIVELTRAETILLSNVPLWDRFFATGVGERWVDKLRQTNPGALILVDEERHRIQVIGAADRRNNVQTKMCEKVEQLRGRHIFRISLNGSFIGLFGSSNLAILQEEHGQENIWIDYSQRVLCARVDESAYEDVQHMVHRVLERHPELLPNACPACLEPPTTPVELPCGHSYCKACMRRFLTSARTLRQFPLECFGMADGNVTCKELIPVAMARNILAPETWDALVKAAFQAYVSAHPDELCYCPTPDCPQVYRPNVQGSIFNCPSCLSSICPYCRVEYHEGVTCKDWLLLRDDMFNRYVSSHDVKQCPGCHAFIERAEGCNHITCSRCHTHTCWECLATFTKGIGIYEHMRSVHGGIGI